MIPCRRTNANCWHTSVIMRNLLCMGTGSDCQDGLARTRLLAVYHPSSQIAGQPHTAAVSRILQQNVPHDLHPRYQSRFTKLAVAISRRVCCKAPRGLDLHPADRASNSRNCAPLFASLGCMRLSFEAVYELVLNTRCRDSADIRQARSQQLGQSCRAVQSSLPAQASGGYTGRRRAMQHHTSILSSKHCRRRCASHQDANHGELELSADATAPGAGSYSTALAPCLDSPKATVDLPRCLLLVITKPYTHQCLYRELRFAGHRLTKT